MFEVGDIINVVVSGIESYGIFVTADNDFTGLIHISEVDTGFVKNINDYVKVGDSIYANILSVDMDNKHLSLSIKNMNYNNNDGDRRKIKENVSGFLPLYRKLDEWIKEKSDELKKEQN